MFWQLAIRLAVAFVLAVGVILLLAVVWIGPGGPTLANLAVLVLTLASVTILVRARRRRQRTVTPTARQIYG
jgi:membrane protein implicated in regulation of membrane protease activity